MSHSDYDKEFTDASFEELKYFIKWMDKNIGAHPIVIGGWAVYAYKPALGSKDIDVMVPTDMDLNNIILESFFKSRGFQTRKEGFFPKNYSKIVEKNGAIKEVVFDLFKGGVMKEDSESIGIRFHWDTVLENLEKKEIGGLPVYVPKIELLITLKVIAAIERSIRFDARDENLAGDYNVAHGASKIWKDYHDIAALASLKADSGVLGKFLKSANLDHRIEKFYSRYSAYQDILKLPYVSRKDLEGAFKAK